MSQSTDAPNRTVRPELKPSAVNRPRIRFLDAAVAIYLVALAAFVVAAAFGARTESSDWAAFLLLIVPMALPGAIFTFLKLMFLASSLAGVPLISFSNTLLAMQRNWRGILGTVLLLGVLCAILALAV